MGQISSQAENDGFKELEQPTVNYHKILLFYHPRSLIYPILLNLNKKHPFSSKRQNLLYLCISFNVELRLK